MNIYICLFLRHKAKLSSLTLPALIFAARLLIYSPGLEAAQMQSNTCGISFLNATSRLASIKNTPHKPKFVYSEISKQQLSGLFKKFEVKSALRSHESGFRMVMEKGGRDPAPFVGLHLGPNRKAVFMGCTANEFIVADSVRALARGGVLSPLTKHARVSKIKLYNENGKEFGVRFDGNDDAWDSKIVYEQDSLTGQLKLDRNGKPKMYIIAGTMDSQKPGEKESSEWDGYPGEFSKNYTRQIRLFDAQVTLDPQSNVGFEITGDNPRSLFHYTSPKKVFHNDELREEWVVSDGAKTSFAHGYGGSVSRLGLWDNYFDIEGRLEVMADEVMPIGPSESTDKRFLPYRTGIKRYSMSNDLNSVKSGSFVLTPEKSPYSNNFFKAAQRSADNGLVEGAHTIKFYEDQTGIHVIQSLDELRRARAMHHAVETLIIGSPGIWGDEYGVWLAHRKNESSNEQYILDSDGELHDPARVLTKAFIQFGRPMISVDEQGTIYLWVHGTPRYKAPAGKSAPSTDERGLMVVPIQLVRLANGQVSFKIIDDTGFIKALEEFKPIYDLEK